MRRLIAIYRHNDEEARIYNSSTSFILHNSSPRTNHAVYILNFHKFFLSNKLKKTLFNCSNPIESVAFNRVALTIVESLMR